MTRTRNGAVVAAVVGAVLITVIAGAPAAIGSEPLLRGIPSQQQLIDALEKPAERGTPRPTTRAAIPLHAPDQPSPAETAAGTADAATAQTGSASLLILFAYNSADLTPQARKQLDAVAGALNSPGLRSFRFEVQGHTDARGSEDYNLQLSQRRAQSVYDYLVGVHGVAPQRLETRGLGKAELYDPSRPDSEINRRVKIVNLGS